MAVKHLSLKHYAKKQVLICRVVSEWSFKKDGVDAAMKDLANETRGAQTDDRDTFLGIGQKRYFINASTSMPVQSAPAMFADRQPRQASCPDCLAVL